MEKAYLMVLRVLLLLLMTTGFASGQRFVQTAPNVAAAVRINPKSIHTHVEILGYTTAGDGGGGRFTFTNTVTSTNLGTRLAMSTAGWSLERQDQGPVSPLWFGAKGDGTTDDTVAMRAATDYITANRRVLEFPDGYTFITDTITPTGGNITWRGNLRIGDKFTVDPTTMVKLKNNATGGLLVIPDGVQGEIRGMYLDGNKANQSVVAPLVDLQGLLFQEFGLVDTLIAYSKGDGVRSTRYESRFANLKILYNDGHGFNGTNINDSTFEHVLIGDSLQNGLHLVNCSNVRIAHLDAFKASWNGIYWNGGFYNRLFNVQVDDNFQHGLSMDMGSSVFIGCNFYLSKIDQISNNGIAVTNPAPATSYSDVHLFGANTPYTFVGCVFGFPNTRGATNGVLPNYAIDDQRTTTPGLGVVMMASPIRMGTNVYANGPFSSLAFEGNAHISGVQLENFGDVIHDVGFNVKLTTNFPYTVGITNKIIFCGLNGTLTNRSVILPARTNIADGTWFLIKDVTGDVAQNIITITAADGTTIDGLASRVIRTDGLGLMIAKIGSAYSTVSASPTLERNSGLVWQFNSKANASTLMDFQNEHSFTTARLLGYSSSGAEFNRLIFQRAGGTIASPVELTAGQTIGMIMGLGYPSPNYSARIVMRAAGTFTSTNTPTDMYIAVSSGATNRVDRYTMISTNGAWRMQDTDSTAMPDLVTILDLRSTTGGLGLPEMTKAQRNTMTNINNRAIMIYQTDNTPGLRVYSNGAWVRYSETLDP